MSFFYLLIASASAHAAAREEFVNFLLSLDCFAQNESGELLIKAMILSTIS